jgi:radical SAM protein with 4Fe4S-binding SPASM domain
MKKLRLADPQNILRLDYDSYPFVKVDCHLHTTPFESWLLVSNNSATESNREIRAMRTLRLTHEQEEIIFSCDGRTRVASVINIMRKVFRIPDKDTISTLSWLYLNGIIDFSKDVLEKPTYPSFGGSRDYFVPLHVFLELTDHCNQKCIHCYLESKPEKNQFADTGMLIRTIENLSFEGTLVAELTGGEPLAHPDFEEILIAAAEFFQITSVISNGTLITDSLIELFLKLRENGNSVLVSITLNSHEKEFHDRFTGLSGSFEKALSSIRKLSAAGIPVRGTMNVTRHNIHHIQQNADLVLDAGASVFAVAPVNPEGRAQKADICLMDDKEWAVFDREFLLLKKRYGDRVFSIPEPAAQEIFDYSCGAGTKTVAISPKGEVRPCVLFDSTHSFGNIFKDEIDKVLNPDNLGILLKDFSPARLGCDKCSLGSICNGCIRRMLKMAPENPSCPLNRHIRSKEGSDESSHC